MHQEAKAELFQRLKALALGASDEDVEALVRALPGVERDLAALAQIELAAREPAFVFRPPAVES